jgi:hypothetical protein
LLGLIDKTDAGRRQKRPNLIGLMSNHHRGIAWRRNGRRCMDYMLDQRHAPGAMEHFRALGFHPGAKASGQDHHIGLGCHLILGG